MPSDAHFRLRPPCAPARAPGACNESRAGPAFVDFRVVRPESDQHVCVCVCVCVRWMYVLWPVTLPALLLVRLLGRAFIADVHRLGDLRMEAPTHPPPREREGKREGGSGRRERQKDSETERERGVHALPPLPPPPFTWRPPSIPLLVAHRTATCPTPPHPPPRRRG